MAKNQGAQAASGTTGQGMGRAAKRPTMPEVLARRARLDAARNEVAEQVYAFHQWVDDNRFEWPGQSQLQNVLTVASASDSDKELEIYIKYQAARSWKGRGRDIGDQLVKCLDGLRAPGGTDDLHLEKARLFLGYLVRLRVARDRASNQAAAGQGG
ncbi:MAG: hypothetical protein HY329_23890 [Chloroflexi bacterium]|nr:hypothetical protein [Chloroflexota bacterium]